MERAIITISESCNVNILYGNVWMSFSELVVLFDVASPTLKAAIRAIHKSGVIAEHTQHCEVMPYNLLGYPLQYGYDCSPCFPYQLIRCGEDT